jgi:hypothetical protein
MPHEKQGLAHHFQHSIVNGMHSQVQGTSVWRLRLKFPSLI